MAPAVKGVLATLVSIRSPDAIDKQGSNLPESTRWLGD
jgi:hypothetical protein